MKILTLKVRIPSSSHNAFSDENGMHWPAGTKFKRLDKRREAWWRSQHYDHNELVFIEQIGGEEVLVAMTQKKFSEVF
jgi:hypothetical protein